MTIKFKEGELYKSRDGRDIIIYRIFEDKGHIHGAILNKLGGWEITSWDGKGRSVAGNIKSGIDIVKPVVVNEEALEKAIKKSFHTQRLNEKSSIRKVITYYLEEVEN